MSQSEELKIDELLREYAEINKYVNEFRRSL